ncbi:MAG TPA: hypothetical protein VF615_00960 [Longimicrobiaceae bacterium]|jgi:hypothetical protein
MTATQTEPPRRKLTLSRETVRTLGGTSLDLPAAVIQYAAGWLRDRL